MLHATFVFFILTVIHFTLTAFIVSGVNSYQILLTLKPSDNNQETVKVSYMLVIWLFILANVLLVLSSWGISKESILPFGMGILFLLVYLNILSCLTIGSWHAFYLLLIFRKILGWSQSFGHHSDTHIHKIYYFLIFFFYLFSGMCSPKWCAQMVVTIQDSLA